MNNLYFCKGRDDFWGAHCIQNSLNVYLDNSLIVSENQRLSHDSIAGSIAARVGHYHVFGIILLFGSRTAAVRQRLEALKGRQFFHQKRNEILSRKNHNQDDVNISRHQQAAMVTVTSVAGFSNCIVRFLCCSSEEMFELLREILQPMSCEMKGLDAYSDRCLNQYETVEGEVVEGRWPAGHPVRVLRDFDNTNHEKHNNEI